MKKFLIFILGLLLATNAHAALISYTSLSSDAGISYGHLNTSFSDIYNEFNGSIDTDNIDDGTLTTVDFADAANPQVRDNELLGSFTYTGHLPATSATLTSNISAGTSYVNGYRVVTAATSKTYTASKDSWLYIDQNGTFQYVELATGSAQPTTPANSLLLAKVTTSGTAITSVTDHRQTVPPNLRVYQDLKHGMVISKDADSATTVNINRGEIEFGTSVTNGLRRNTTAAEIDCSTAGRGGLDTGTMAEGYYYVFAVADDDNSTNYEGIAGASSVDAHGVTGERCVGWFYASSATAISPDSLGAHKLAGDAPNVVEISDTAKITRNNTAFGDMMHARFVSSGRPCRVRFFAPVEMSGGAGTAYCTLSIDDVGYMDSGVYCGLANVPYTLELDWKGTLEAGQHDVKIRWREDGGTVQQPADAYDTPRVLIVEEL